MSDDAPIITLRDLAAAINRERIRQGVKLIELDHVAGLQNGYSAKIVANIKRLGELSLPGMLRALNLRLVLAPCKHSEIADVSIDCEVVHNEYRKSIASAGGRARAIKLDASRRREIARQAALARHKRDRLLKQAGIAVAKKKVGLGKSGEKQQGELF